MTGSATTTRTDHQYGLVAWLAHEFGSRGQLGKKAIQKLVYILENCLQVKTGYNFQLYTYGPFSRDLAGDLDILDGLGAIDVTYIREENRYVVAGGQSFTKFVSDAEDFFASHSRQLDVLKDNFGGKTARELELFSTLHYLVENSTERSDTSIVKKLMSLKPKYSMQETLECLHQVKSFGKKSEATETASV